MLDAIAKEGLRLHATAPIGSIRQAKTSLNPVISSLVSFCPFFSFVSGASTLFLLLLLFESPVVCLLFVLDCPLFCPLFVLFFVHPLVHSGRPPLRKCKTGVVK